MTITTVFKERLSRCPRRNAGAFLFGRKVSFYEVRTDHRGYAGGVPGGGLVVWFRGGGKGEEKRQNRVGKNGSHFDSKPRFLPGRVFAWAGKKKT